VQLSVVIQVVLEASVGAVDGRNMRREVGWAFPSLRWVIRLVMGIRKSWQ
jgi:hypothetical protein